MEAEYVEVVKSSNKSNKAPKSNGHIIEVGDSIKVKQTFDDCLIDAFGDTENLKQIYALETKKVIIMVLAIIFAVTAQFYPLPFPKNRLLLAVCCAAYFILSGIFQLFVWFVEKDIICTFESDGKRWIARTTFPKFQEFYTLKLQNQTDYDVGNESKATTAVFYVGNYFTERGEFHELGFKSDLATVLSSFRKNEGKTFEFNHSKKIN